MFCWRHIACFLWLLPFTVQMKQGFLGMTHPSGWVSSGKPARFWWCQIVSQAMKCTACDNSIRNQQNPNAFCVQLYQQHFLWEWNTLSLVCDGDHKYYSCDLFWVVKGTGINLHTRVKGYRTCVVASCALLCLQ